MLPDLECYSRRGGGGGGGVELIVAVASDRGNTVYSSLSYAIFLFACRMLCETLFLIVPCNGLVKTLYQVGRGL